MPGTTLGDGNTVETEMEGMGEGERERWREMEGGRWGRREEEGKRENNALIRITVYRSEDNAIK